jgi:hypothetical protein
MTVGEVCLLAAPLLHLLQWVGSGVDVLLAVLYSPTTMPPNLERAHAALDRAVDGCYRKAAFASERERVEFLFARYRALTEPLLALMTPPRGRTRAR